MCWPLHIQGKTVGVLSMNRFESDQAFDERDLQRGAIMANMLALVIENLRMHREQQLRIRHLSELNERLAALNHQLADAQAQLLQRDKLASIGQLAAGIAHEINNPLGFISSNLSSLSGYMEPLTSALATLSAGRPQPDARLADMLEDIPALLGETRDGLERVKKIVQDLRDFSRVDSAQEVEEISLNDALRSAINMCAAGLADKPVFDLDLDDLPVLHCNPGQIGQALLAILQNAVQACAPAKPIHVRSRFVGEEIVLEIEDEGCGIAPENMSRIFEPFFTTKPVGHGTGLGLSVAYSAIQKHHGGIDVHSTLGRGSCFRIRLPVLPTRD
jgi:signal transduction histidine kinase